MKYSSKQCPICRKSKKKIIFKYFSKPKIETKFKNIDYKNYYRHYYKCQNCEHFFSNKNFFSNNFYESNYSHSTYKLAIEKNFKRVTSLPKKKSDNYHRVLRIKKFNNKNYKIKSPKLLDIGSGIGVFPYQMKKNGWIVTALETDITSSEHIKNNLKIKCLNNDFYKIKLKKKFNFITLNKVLEHVEFPQVFLKKAIKLLKSKGIVYVEIPDAINAGKKSKNREEFAIEHIHVFSTKSLKIMLKNLKLKIMQIKSIKEPSGKFTIFAFAQKY